MRFKVSVRVTRTRKCREGFYLLLNGQRLRVATRALAIEQVRGFLDLQRIQILTVREYQRRNERKIEREMETAR